MVIQKNPCMLIQVPDSFFQAARSPSGWLGRKCFSHFQSHKNHYQTPVVHKAGHALKTGVRGVQKEKQVLQRHPQANLAKRFSRLGKTVREKGCSFWHNLLVNRSRLLNKARKVPQYQLPVINENNLLRKQRTLSNCLPWLPCTLPQCTSSFQNTSLRAITARTLSMGCKTKALLEIKRSCSIYF